MDLLGDTLEKVAVEKAGIIKKDVPVVISETSSFTSEVFKKKAKKQEKIISVQSRCLNYYEKVSSSTTSSGPFFLLISDQRLLPLSSSAVRMCLQPSVFFLW
jgi:folylpolyglutamate synthase/dihydropteroate synthase